MSAARVPIAVRITQVLRGLPDFPGRDTLLHMLLSLKSCYPDAVIEGTFGRGLRFAGNPAADRNILELALLRFARPALTPILDAALEPGAVFADVGAHLGLYTLWAARRVGSSGRVHAFEPVPGSAATLKRNAELNDFSHVQVNVSAVGAEPGRIQLYRVPLYSGVTSRYSVPKRLSIEVPVTTLDAHFAEETVPDLIKIDVEGMEFEVLRGARGLLAGTKPPVIVFEANADFFAAANTSYREVIAYLANTGSYTVWSLNPGGLRREPPDALTPNSLNVLAVREGHAPHDRVIRELRNKRFEKNQNA